MSDVGRIVKVRSDLHPWRVSMKLRGKIGRIEKEGDHHYYVKIGQGLYKIGKDYVKLKKVLDKPPE